MIDELPVYQGTHIFYVHSKYTFIYMTMIDMVLKRLYDHDDVCQYDNMKKKIFIKYVLMVVTIASSHLL